MFQTSWDELLFFFRRNHQKQEFLFPTTSFHLSVSYSVMFFCNQSGNTVFERCYIIPYEFLCHTCVRLCEPVALPAVPSWSHTAQRTEGMSAHGCLRLSGALQEVSFLCPGVPPTPSAHLLHLACSPSTWMEIYQDQWRSEVTNHITGAGVGVSFNPSLWGGSEH